MPIKAIVSAAALTVALGFAGSAAAQTMIGNQSVSEADHQRVLNYCEDLKNADNQAVSETDNDETATTEANNGTGTDDANADANAMATDTDDSDPAAVGSVDFDQITLENCIEAGFVTR